MRQLRPYQQTAIDAVAAHQADGHQGVCLVAPTGAGKSVMGSALASRSIEAGRRVAWLVHRVLLAEQAAEHFARDGMRSVGLVSPNHPPNPAAQIQVVSIDTVVARGELPDADDVIHDECHHSQASTHSEVLDTYLKHGARLVGLTATPQRADGRALGNHFTALVVAAKYSELLEWGNLVPCRVFQPPEHLTGGELALDPVEAWVKHADGQSTFAFTSTKAEAKKLAARFNDIGIGAAVIDDKTSKRERDRIMAGFRAGTIRVLTNVNVLTEGIDVPDARVCLLARNPGHAGTYLQMVGRVLRTAEGKTEARLIDLTGCSLNGVHGLPTADREYALSGRAIKVSGESLKVCPECGVPVPIGTRVCDEAEGGCGYEWPAPPKREVTIHNLELREAAEAAGGIEQVGDDLRRRELQRLMDLCAVKGWSVYWATKQYEILFGHKPSKAWMNEAASDKQKADELVRLRRIRAARGKKPGWERFVYKSTFGVMP